ncbi:MAG: hydrogenase iron-sulfur subunit [bacterium]
MTIHSHAMVKNETEHKTDWQPKVVAFLCNWRLFTGTDLTDKSRLLHVSHVEIIRVPCSGRVDPLFLLKCFEKGADGILVAGCYPGSCRYSPGNHHAQGKLAIFRTLLEFCGIDARRLHFSWASSSEGTQWPKLLDNVVSQVTEAGPFPDLYSRKDKRS